MVRSVQKIDNCCHKEVRNFMKTIQVLMSTYNGEKYLNEQIDSIIAQDCENKGLAQVKLLIRDDGSSDSTRNILESYASKYPDIVSWYTDGNKGVIKSFFDLLDSSDEEADYYAFADQDDYWMPEKLSAGIAKIEAMKKESPDIPLLYCCRPKLVDENLVPLVSEIKRPPMRPSFNNALIENIVTGCTIVMDRKLRDVVKANNPEYTVMHDWWFYIIASSFGRVYYDETPYICYRQHGGNEVGTNVSRSKEFKDRVKRFKGNRRNISNQMTEFLRIYENCQKNDIAYKYIGKSNAKECIRLARKLVDSRKSLIARIRLVKGKEAYRQRKMDDRIFKIILLSGSF